MQSNTNKGQGGDAKERQKKEVKNIGEEKTAVNILFPRPATGACFIFVHLFWADASCKSEGNESGL